MPKKGHKQLTMYIPKEELELFERLEGKKNLNKFINTTIKLANRDSILRKKIIFSQIKGK